MAEKEYIERESLIKYAEKQEVIIKDGLSIADAMRIQGNVFRRCVGTCPAADVAPVRHGRWINENFYTRCSACGNMAIYDKYGQEVESDYCPRCGAKMDRKEE